MFIELQRAWSINMRSIPPALGVHGAFNFLTFEEDQITFLDIGGTRSGAMAASSAELNTILPQITLPALRYVRITIELDPEAFTQFLMNHPALTIFQYMATTGSANAMLTTRPIALPRLMRISCRSAEQLGPLLDALHPSPDLSKIVLPFNGLSRAFKLALRRLSLHTAPIQLVLDSGETEDPEEWEPLDELDRLIASCLYCVELLDISSDSEEDMRALLPWLACLPALQSLGLLRSKDDTDKGQGSSLTSVVEDFRVTLHWVPDIALVRSLY